MRNHTHTHTCLDLKPIEPTPDLFKLPAPQVIESNTDSAWAAWDDAVAAQEARH